MAAVLDAVQTEDPAVGALPIGGLAAPAAPYSPTFPHLKDRAAADERAREVWLKHKSRREAKRELDLKADLLLAALAGEQWLDIQYGRIVPVPQDAGSIRNTNNVLRTLVSVAIAYHTGTPVRVSVKAKPDRVSRDQSRLDALVMNDVLQRNQYNQLLATALGIGGACYGVGILHAFWRDDLAQPEFEPYAVMGADASVPAEMEMPNGPGDRSRGVYAGKLRHGYVDIVVGDPWGTTYDEGATRWCVHEMAYERTVPLALARAGFADVPGIEELQGTTRLASAARLQRSRRAYTELVPHGSRRILSENRDGTELVALVYEETVPGMLKEWPRGRLSVVGLSGTASGDASESGAAVQPVLLYEGPLPGGVRSAQEFYLASPDQTDSIWGIPWLDDKLEDQQVINMVESRVMNYIAKLTDPLVVAQQNMIDMDALAARGGVHGSPILEYLAGNPPAYLQVQQGLGDVTGMIDRRFQALYTKSGFQAASRGEGKSGQAAAAVVALAKADDSVHGTAAAAMQASVVEHCRRIHAIIREHLSLPWVLENTGSDHGYLAPSYVHASQLSERPPVFEVSSFWGTPEQRVQQLYNMLNTQMPDGTTLIDRDYFFEHHPDQSLRPVMNETPRLRRARAAAVAEWIRQAVTTYRKSQTVEVADEIAAEGLHSELEQAIPRLRDDDLQFHLEKLSEITQDVESDPIAVLLASWRQDLIYEQQQAQQQVQAMGQMVPQPGMGAAPTSQAAQAQGGSPPAPEVPAVAEPQVQGPASAQMDPAALAGDVRGLTSEATQEQPQ